MPLLQRQHAIQQGNLASAAQRVAQPTASDKFYLQSSLPFTGSNQQFSRGGLAGGQPDQSVAAGNGYTQAPLNQGVEGEKMPLFYWWGLAAWNKTRGTARVDLMRPRHGPSAPLPLMGLPRLAQQITSPMLNSVVQHSFTVMCVALQIPKSGPRHRSLPFSTQARKAAISVQSRALCLTSLHMLCQLTHDKWPDTAELAMHSAQRHCSAGQMSVAEQCIVLSQASGRTPICHE